MLAALRGNILFLCLPTHFLSPSCSPLASYLMALSCLAPSLMSAPSHSHILNLCCFLFHSHPHPRALRHPLLFFPVPCACAHGLSLSLSLPPSPSSLSLSRTSLFSASTLDCSVSQPALIPLSPLRTSSALVLSSLPFPVSPLADCPPGRLPFLCSVSHSLPPAHSHSLSALPLTPLVLLPPHGFPLPFHLRFCSGANKHTFFLSRTCSCCLQRDHYESNPLRLIEMNRICLLPWRSL